MSNQTSTLIQTPTGIHQNKKYNFQPNTRVQQTYKNAQMQTKHSNYQTQSGYFGNC